MVRAKYRHHIINKIQICIHLRINTHTHTHTRR